uniref:Type II toxin-antitoxin system VapB family antitoxin n=1 Tax=Roseihalotalea indica TaxID=2867963 RepID=A0AA49JGB5_9BACT|nr:type II toxin-antitoxin system VapB family antitoxin [Tunicatimonas sp. TK19036]
MRTNIDIDDDLISDAMKILNVKTKKEAVEVALRRVKEEAARQDIRTMRGKAKLWPEYGQDINFISK